VERLFQTLQDRLIKAMRVQAVSSMEEANAWLHSCLQTHNHRFAGRNLNFMASCYDYFSSRFQSLSINANLVSICPNYPSILQSG
jgi:hypothetical protein